MVHKAVGSHTHNTDAHQTKEFKQIHKSQKLFTLECIRDIRWRWKTFQLYSVEEGHYACRFW